MSLEKYLAIKGVGFRKSDLMVLKESDFVAFFEIVKFLTKGSSLSCSKENVAALEDSIMGKDGYPGFKAEVLYRINCFTKEEFTSIGFFNKIKNMILQIGNHLRKNPSQITENMSKIIEEVPKLQWINKQYKDYETQIGATIVQPDINGMGSSKAVVASPQVKFMDTITKMADLGLHLMSSISKKDIAKMTTTERLKWGLAVTEFMKAVSTVKGPNSLTQINIYKEGKDALEKAMLNFKTK